MTQTKDDRQYLNPRMLAKIGSLDLRARLIVEGLTSGMHRSPYQGISVEFAQHRQYVQGDDIRHVDWKVLAKTDKVYLKQYQEETSLQLICVVDASQSMSFATVMGSEDSGSSRVQSRLKLKDGRFKAEDGKTKSERGASNDAPDHRSFIFDSESSAPLWSKYDHATAISAALSYLTIQQQDSAGLAVFDSALCRFLKPSNAPRQWKMITKELQLVPRRSKTNTGKILNQLAEKLTHRSVIVIISDFFDDLSELKKGLRQLRYKKHEVMAFQTLDPAELTFPFKDVTLFRGLEDSGQLLTDPKSLRESYLHQLKLFTEDLKKMCRGMQIDFTQLNTAEPLDVSLSAYLANRSASIR
jgi:uncharacterized protein (DUF58 family)